MYLVPKKVKGSGTQHVKAHVLARTVDGMFGKVAVAICGHKFLMFTKTEEQPADRPMCKGCCA